jgi:hypothetical protein
VSGALSTVLEKPKESLTSLAGWTTKNRKPN